VPFSASLGLFTPQVLTIAALTVPAVLIGAAAGRAAIHRVSQRQFEYATLAATAGGASLLIVR